MFGLVVLACFGLYLYDKYKLKEKRKNRILETIEMLIKGELRLLHSIDRKIETYEYADRDLYLTVYKKRDIVYIRAYIKNVFGDEKMVYSSEYDATWKEWKRDKWHYENLDIWWNTMKSKDMIEISKLKQYLVTTAEKKFNLAIQNPKNVQEPVAETKTMTFVANENKGDSFFKPVYEAMIKGDFHWKKENEKEIYSFHLVPSWKITSEKKEDFHHIEIKQEDEFIADIEYKSETKDVNSLTINKAWVHQIKDNDTFIYHLQNILYYMYDKGVEKQDLLKQKLQDFQQRSQGFQEKERKMEELITFIEKNKEQLDLETKHLYERIKGEKLSEVNELRNKIPHHPEYEKDVENMMEMLIDLLEGVEKKIKEYDAKNAELKERLLQSLHEEYKQE